MKVVNKTKYNGRQLRAFITWVSNQEGWEPAMRKRLSVEVVLARKWHTGEAWKRSYHIEIRIPGSARLNKAKLASLIAHELKHLTNRQHIPYSTERWMRGPGPYGHRDCEKYWSAAHELPLEVPTPKAKPVATPLSRAQAGLAHAEAKVAEYEVKLRRTENLLKKWRKKARYYEGRVEKVKDLPPPAPRKKAQPSEETLLRRAINKHITAELADCDRQTWEVYSMMRRPSMQASGLRHPDEEGWEGDFTDLKHARKEVLPGETMMLHGYKDDLAWDDIEITIPDRDTLLGREPARMAAQVAG